MEGRQREGIGRVVRQGSFAVIGEHEYRLLSVAGIDGGRGRGREGDLTNLVILALSNTTKTKTPTDHSHCICVGRVGLEGNRRKRRVWEWKCGSVEVEMERNWLMHTRPILRTSCLRFSYWNNAALREWNRFRLMISTVCNQ